MGEPGAPGSASITEPQRAPEVDGFRGTPREAASFLSVIFLKESKKITPLFLVFFNKKVSYRRSRVGIRLGQTV